MIKSFVRLCRTFLVICIVLMFSRVTFAQANLQPHEATELIKKFDSEANIFRKNLETEQVKGHWKKIFLGSCDSYAGCSSVRCEGACSQENIFFEINSMMVRGFGDEAIDFSLTDDRLYYNLIGGVDTNEEYINATPCKKFNKADVLICRDSKIRNRASFFSIYERQSL